VIKIGLLRIHDFRGIREITLDLSSNNFAVCGPNGSGKSGVVDAIEFVLTGDISRLVGKGTGGLSVKEHGPHVDSTPEHAFVEAQVRRCAKRAASTS
jgi:DNA repair exonuclease SbcCD ATPase subunit